MRCKLSSSVLKANNCSMSNNALPENTKKRVRKRQLLFILFTGELVQRLVFWEKVPFSEKCIFSKFTSLCFS